jgi:hypothetical protein
VLSIFNLARIGKARHMSDTEETREHEREAAEREPAERSPEGEREAGEPAAQPEGPREDRPAPPGFPQQA